MTAVPRQLWKMTQHEGESDQDEDLYFDQDARSFQDEDLAGEELEFVTIIKIGNEQSEVEKSTSYRAWSDHSNFDSSDFDSDD